MKFLQANLTYVRFLGYWHTTDNIVYKCYTLFQIILILSYGITQIIYLAITPVSFIDLLHIISEISVTFLSLYRICVWLHFEQQIRNILNFIKLNNFNETDSIIRKAHTFALGYSLFLINYPYVSIVLLYILPLLQILEESTYKNVKLPSHNWLPFVMFQSKNYFMFGLIYQIYGYWISASTICTIHSTILSLMIKVGAHYELLAEQISSLNAEQPNAEKQLDHFIQEYHNIFHFAKTIGDINSIQWIGQLMPQAYMLCSSIILIASRPISETGNDFFLAYSCLFDLFVYCWFGEQITYQSNRITLKMWETNWHIGSLKFRKKFLATMIIFGRGYTFKIGGFFLWRLQSFMQILRLTYSVYTVLNKFS